MLTLVNPLVDSINWDEMEPKSCGRISVMVLPILSKLSVVVEAVVTVVVLEVVLVVVVTSCSTISNKHR